MESIALSIIIVSWNVRDLLRSCLQSIGENRHELGLEVIVVDAGSDDNSAEMVRNEFKWVRLIAEDENVGFPKGNNIGIRQSAGRHVLLLNPDTEIIDHALAHMVDYLDAHAEVGAVGPQLLNPDGSVQSSRRRFPTLITAFFESTWFEQLAPDYLLRHYYFGDVPVSEIVQVDWLTGACLMVRHNVIGQIGLLDEEYFMYSEELDWCHRMKEKGWQIVYLPEAKVVHHVGKSSEQAVTARHVNFQRAKLRYFRKYHGWLPSTLLRTFLLINYAWQLVLEALKGVIGHKRPLRWQRVKAYWHVLRTGLRPAGY